MGVILITHFQSMYMSFFLGPGWGTSSKSTLRVNRGSCNHSWFLFLGPQFKEEQHFVTSLQWVWERYEKWKKLSQNSAITSQGLLGWVAHPPGGQNWGRKFRIIEEKWINRKMRKQNFLLVCPPRSKGLVKALPQKKKKKNGRGWRNKKCTLGAGNLTWDLSGDRQ